MDKSIKPRITSIRFSSGKYRPKPQLGDTKMIKGILHRREFARTLSGAFDCTGGRQNYVWVPVETTRPEVTHER